MARKRIPLFLSAAAVVLFAGAVEAAPPPPSSAAHPRLWLDSDMLAHFQTAASDPGSAVSVAISRCKKIRDNPSSFSKGGWQGFEWAKAMSSCLVAYQATGSSEDAATALFYFEVLLDDYQNVGDGLGGDDVVQHDTGYAIRSFAVYSAIGYDWLHDAPGMTEALRSKARGRFKKWAEWYKTDGYLNHDVGANYHAGWVFAATAMAVAQAGEGDDDSLWDYVIDEIFAVDMAEALAKGGVLDGGDWAEGWQYGPLAVLSYSLSAQALIEHGVSLSGFEEWNRQVVRRHVYAMTPDRSQTFAAGDTSSSQVNLNLSPRPLFAALIGPASAQTRAWAASELVALDPDIDGTHLFAAMAEARLAEVTPEPFPRDSAALAYLAQGTGNYYSRSSFAEEALWSVLQCSPRVVPDHQHLNAGNLVLSRGDDHLLVDPTPYGSLSTLTGNAPTVTSNVLSESYRPSQGPFGIYTGFEWVEKTASGVVTARCDYADQFAKHKHGIPSDIDLAERDVVLVGDESESAAIVIDRAETGSVAKKLHLRFRTAADLASDGGVYVATVGDSSLRIAPVSLSGSANPAVRAMPTDGECWEVPRGQCDFARYAGDEYRVELEGSSTHAVHVLDIGASGATPAAAEYSQEDGYSLLQLVRDGTRYAVVEAPLAPSLVYRAPHSATHIILGAPADADGNRDVSATLDGDSCDVSIELPGGTELDAHAPPLVLHLDSDCQATEDPVMDGGETPPDEDEDEPGEDEDDSPEPDNADEDGASGGDHGGGCSSAASGSSTALAALLLAVIGAFLRRRPAESAALQIRGAISRPNSPWDRCRSRHLLGWETPGAGKMPRSGESVCPARVRW